MQPAVMMYMFAEVSAIKSKAKAKAEINVEMVCNVISELLATCYELKLRTQKLIWALRHIHSAKTA